MTSYVCPHFFATFTFANKMKIVPLMLLFFLFFFFFFFGRNVSVLLIWRRKFIHNMTLLAIRHDTAFGQSKTSFHRRHMTSTLVNVSNTRIPKLAWLLLFFFLNYYMNRGVFIFWTLPSIGILFFNKSIVTRNRGIEPDYLG